MRAAAIDGQQPMAARAKRDRVRSRAARAAGTVGEMGILSRRPREVRPAPARAGRGFMRMGAPRDGRIRFPSSLQLPGQQRGAARPASRLDQTSIAPLARGATAQGAIERFIAPRPLGRPAVRTPSSWSIAAPRCRRSACIQHARGTRRRFSIPTIGLGAAAAPPHAGSRAARVQARARPGSAPRRAPACREVPCRRIR